VLHPAPGVGLQLATRQPHPVHANRHAGFMYKAQSPLPGWIVRVERTAQGEVAGMDGRMRGTPVHVHQAAHLQAGVDDHQRAATGEEVVPVRLRALAHHDAAGGHRNALARRRLRPGLEDLELRALGVVGERPLVVVVDAGRRIDAQGALHRLGVVAGAAHFEGGDLPDYGKAAGLGCPGQAQAGQGRRTWPVAKAGASRRTKR
jgi:hypothetical protein